MSARARFLTHLVWIVFALAAAAGCASERRRPAVKAAGSKAKTWCFANIDSKSPPDSLPPCPHVPGGDPSAAGCPSAEQGKGFCGKCESTGVCGYCQDDAVSTALCSADPCKGTMAPAYPGGPDVPFSCLPPEHDFCSGGQHDCYNGTCCPDEYPVCCPDGWTCGTSKGACANREFDFGTNHCAGKYLVSCPGSSASSARCGPSAPASFTIDVPTGTDSWSDELGNSYTINSECWINMMPGRCPAQGLVQTDITDSTMTLPVVCPIDCTLITSVSCTIEKS